ncbi:MAG: hypothetical protein R3E76_05160 [Planctomycetota bacterium]
MKKNEDRIWDILLEDAVRDIPTPAEPQEMGDHTRRLLQPVGPLGVDRGRSMRRTRGKRWTSVTVTAVAFMLVATLFYSAVTWLPKLAEDNHTEQPQSADSNKQTPERNEATDKPAPKPQPKEQPAPETNPEPKPEPEGSDPNQPEENPEPEPKPEDQPKEPVEQPKPQPETQPEPEPKKPDDVVEQPKPEPTEPKQPEETTPTPDTGLHINLLTEMTEADWYKPGDKLLQVSSDGELWSQAFKMTQFAGNIWLRSRSAMDFEAGGVFLRLSGTMRVSLTDTGLEVELTENELYVDNRGAGKDVAFTDGKESADLVGCEVYFERSSSRTKVSLFEGKMKVGDDFVTAPKEGSLTKRGSRDFRDPLPRRDRPTFMNGIESRVVYHEDFEAEEPEGRLREGMIEDGVLKGRTVFWGYPEDTATPYGLVIRLHVRFTGTDKVTLTQFSRSRRDNFSYEIDEEHGLKVGEWYTLEVPLSEFRERTNHRDPPNEDDWFQNVSLTPNGENALVELDWVELIRAVK